jgi:hypothetical protein
MDTVNICARPAPHICTVNGPCNGWPQSVVKPFPPTPYKVVTLIINEDGSQTFLKTDSADCFLELGEVVTGRASHVLPATFWKRQAFRLFRILGDAGRIAQWTRGWRGPWLVDTAPTAGVVLEGRWMNRQDAIAAEVAFLNDWLTERKIS